jgi:hypothetical protein
MSALESQSPGKVFCRVNRYRFMIWAICLGGLGLAPVANAGSEDAKESQDAQNAALLQQVKQLASKGQDAQTAGQVNQYVDQNHDVISAILKGYTDYFKQVQTAPTNDGAGLIATGTTPTTTPSASVDSPTTTQPVSADSPTTTQSASADSPTTTTTTATVDPLASTALQPSSVQASGGLQTSHLAGYPALPTVDPVTSINQPTAAQLEYAARMQKAMQARKAYLMAHPEGYTY